MKGLRKPQPVFLADDSDDQIFEFFCPDGATVALDETGSDGETKLIRKTILRTGTWKLRPSPSGPKREPLGVYRDKAPKGHISMSELVKNFDAGAIDHVTVPKTHEDKVDENTGYVRALSIKDNEDGSSELVADIEFTEPDIQGQVERGTIPNVSAGVIFDFIHKQTAKKFKQILAHVCLTGKPWINGMTPFPEGVAADQEFDADEVVSLERESSELKPEVPEPGKPPATLADPSVDDDTPPTPGSTLWKAEEGSSWVRAEISGQLRQLRQAAIMNGCSSDAIPYYQVEDISMAGTEPKALITCGYGADQQTWVANFTVTDGEVKIDAPNEWVEARSEWVAASDAMFADAKMSPAEQAIYDKTYKRLTAAGTAAKQADALAMKAVQRSRTTKKPATTSSSSSKSNYSDETPLQRAQRARRERLSLSEPTTKTTRSGGTTMGLKLKDLLDSGVELTDEQKAEFEQAEAAEAEAEAAKEAELEAFRADKRKAAGTKLADKLVEINFPTSPGIIKWLNNMTLSDDGAEAINFQDRDESGKEIGKPEAKTATQLFTEFFEMLPKDDEGKLTFAQQIRNDDPSDLKPPEEPVGGGKSELKDEDAGDRATALADELQLPWAQPRTPAGAAN